MSLLPPTPTPTPPPADSPQSAIPNPQFLNCPFIDFSNPARQAEFSAAIAQVAAAIPLSVPVVVSGQARKPGREVMIRRCPSDLGREVAHVSMATLQDADDAIADAWAAFPAWRERPLEERCHLLEILADRLTADRVPLAALLVWEVGKPWNEADADVAEAIDFCRYYARQARIELGPQPMSNIPGEDNVLFYEGRGPTVVISPWNFPLAILCGMTVASLVAGDPVLLKPSQQSCAIAHALYRHMIAAGFPAEVVQFVPGVGRVIGNRLVEHPKVAQIAFTGSLEVGLGIIEKAAKTQSGQPQVKRVACEMGGKNAIIVDEDADVEAAVAGAMKSAFGYAGQKCSACSRVILVGAVASPFIERFVAAARALPLSPAQESDCRLGPVVDEGAFRRLMDVSENPGEGAKLLYRGPLREGGWFVPPALFEVRDPKHRLMQEEFFGPVVAIYRAASFDEALEAAVGTEYALTGGIYSPSPEHLDAARARFRVGNLYVNRPITGAMVGRQPFGGFAMSGLGAKAGGPDYLVQFAQPRCVTNNTNARLAPRG